MSNPVVCKCGSRTFVRITPARGSWREYVTFDEEGNEDVNKSESTTDDITLGTPPKTIRCAECGKRHPNQEANQ